ncbi:hypothetical protein BH10ACT7_BH10ACT7_11960 [soil metagenome]
MARANLGALLGNVVDETPPRQEPTADPRPPAAASETDSREPTESSKTAAPPDTPTSRSQRPSTAPYLRLVRKETRLREDQQNQLTLEARRLNRAKAVGTARITDNTLIRVAVDLLLARIREAKGDDERALLESLKPRQK